MNYYEFLDRRITSLEKALRVTNEAVDYSDKKKAFTDICKSCNLTDISFRGKTAVCNFNMETLYRRIIKRLHNKYRLALKMQFNKTCKLQCDMSTEEWFVYIGKDKEQLSINVIPKPGDKIPLDKKFSRDRVLTCLGYAIERILDRIGAVIL